MIYGETNAEHNNHMDFRKIWIWFLCIYIENFFRYWLGNNCGKFRNCALLGVYDIFSILSIQYCPSRANVSLLTLFLIVSLFNQNLIPDFWAWSQESHSSVLNQSHQLLHHCFCFFFQLFLRRKFWSQPKNRKTSALETM